MSDNKHEQNPQDQSSIGFDDSREEPVTPDVEQGRSAASEAESRDYGALSELDKAKAEIVDLNSRLLRLHADFENYRRRVTREKEELAIYANRKLLLGLLPVLDNLERALSTPRVEGDDGLRQGVELTARSFREILSKEGLTPIEAVGQPFDPNFHEAVMTVDSDEHEDGTILAELQKGYRLGERVIRPSMVQVSKKG